MCKQSGFLDVDLEKGRVVGCWLRSSRKVWLSLRRVSDLEESRCSIDDDVCDHHLLFDKK
jgi:hypothetical protein